MQIVNVALPTIQRELGATVMGLQWIVDGYALVFAALLLTAGSLGDQLGAKRDSLVGLGGFILASAVCRLAPTLLVLQIARAVQGIGAAVLVPTSLALLSHSLPDARLRARAVGLWASMGGLGGVMGPVIGSLLASTLGLRSIFFVNVPVGAMTFLLTLRCVRATPRLPGHGIDASGQAVGAVTLALLTFTCIEGDTLGWRSPIIVAVLLGCALCLALFIVRERRVPHPMLPLRMFTNASFSAANVVGGVLNFGYYGQIFLLSLYFQQLRGYTPVLTGLALLPETGMVAVAAVVSGRLSGRTGPRLPMLIGLGVGAVGFFGLLVAGAATSYGALSVPLLMVGGGTALTVPATTVALIEAVGPLFRNLCFRSLVQLHPVCQRLDHLKDKGGFPVDIPGLLQRHVGVVPGSESSCVTSPCGRRVAGTADVWLSGGGVADVVDPRYSHCWTHLDRSRRCGHFRVFIDGD